MDDIDYGPLELEMLPAKHGDSLLLTWGPPSDRHRLLIDGGPARAYEKVAARLKKVKTEGPLDLMVLTHIDADHIEGTLLLANDADLGIDITECWFNGFAQVDPKMGGAQAEMLAALISARKIPLNAAFDKAAICVPEAGGLPVRCLPGGLTLTVLGPDRDALEALRKAWKPTAQDEGLWFASEKEALEALRKRKSLNPTGPTFLSEGECPDVTDLAKPNVDLDTKAPNRSSIVLLAEYAGSAILLPGDATPAALATGVSRLLAERGIERLELTAFKLPHHGSARNITKALLELVPADHYMFSSDGGRHGHPDDAGVARCLAYGKRGSALMFNYRNPRTLKWDRRDVLGPRDNRAIYPAKEHEGVTLSVDARKRTG